MEFNKNTLANLVGLLGNLAEQLNGDACLKEQIVRQNATADPENPMEEALSLIAHAEVINTVLQQPDGTVSPLFAMAVEGVCLDSERDKPTIDVAVMTFMINTDEADEDPILIAQLYVDSTSQAVLVGVDAIMSTKEANLVSGVDFQGVYENLQAYRENFGDQVADVIRQLCLAMTHTIPAETLTPEACQAQVWATKALGMLDAASTLDLHPDIIQQVPSLLALLEQAYNVPTKQLCDAFESTRQERIKTAQPLTKGDVDTLVTNTLHVEESKLMMTRTDEDLQIAEVIQNIPLLNDQDEELDTLYMLVSCDGISVFLGNGGFILTTVSELDDRNNFNAKHILGLISASQTLSTAKAAESKAMLTRVLQAMPQPGTNKMQTKLQDALLFLKTTP